jgi:hypothetical protein
MDTEFLRTISPLIACSSFLEHQIRLMVIYSASTNETSHLHIGAFLIDLTLATPMMNLAGSVQVEGSTDQHVDSFNNIPFAKPRLALLRRGVESPIAAIAHREATITTAEDRLTSSSSHCPSLLPHAPQARNRERTPQIP